MEIKQLALSTLLIYFCADVLVTGNERLQNIVRREKRSHVGESERLERSGLDGCIPLNNGCSGLPKCCGETQCYWEEGYSMLEMGRCVKCVKEYQKCQRDSQCCGHLQCDKGNALWMDGTCQRYRRIGLCYRDGQCVTACKKKFPNFFGQCT